MMTGATMGAGIEAYYSYKAAQIAGGTSIAVAASYVNNAVTTYSASELQPTQPYVYQSEVDELAKVIGEKGIEAVDPILVRVHQGVAYIVDGHHRFYAFLQNGYDRVPIKYLHESNLGKNLYDGTYIRTIEEIINGAKMCSE